MSDNILNVGQQPESKEDWEAAKIVVRYMNNGNREERLVTVTRDEVIDEKREELIEQRGVPADALKDFDISVEQFQGLVYAAARQLAMSPIYVPAQHKFLSPMAVTEVVVSPIQKSRILTPDSSVVVPN